MSKNKQAELSSFKGKFLKNKKRGATRISLIHVEVVPVIDSLFVYIPDVKWKGVKKEIYFKVAKHDKSISVWSAHDNEDIMHAGCSFFKEYMTPGEIRRIDIICKRAFEAFVKKMNSSGEAIYVQIQKPKK